jgi:hypothetical protein
VLNFVLSEATAYICFLSGLRYQLFNRSLNSLPIFLQIANWVIPAQMSLMNCVIPAKVPLVVTLLASIPSHSPCIFQHNPITKSYLIPWLIVLLNVFPSCRDNSISFPSLRGHINLIDLLFHVFCKDSWWFNLNLWCLFSWLRYYSYWFLYNIRLLLIILLVFLV